MKVFEETVTIPIEWKYTSDGTTLRSTVTCGYQGEIHRGVLKVIGPTGAVYSEWSVSTRTYGRKKFSKVIAAMCSGVK